MLDLKFVLFYFVSTIYSFFCFSQSNDHSQINSKSGYNVNIKPKLSISVTPYVVNKAKATPLTGDYHLTTTYMGGVEAGPDYYVNFKKNYSLIVGFHVGAAARSFELYISKSDFSPNLTGDVQENMPSMNSEYDFYISMPIWFGKRWVTKNGSFWNLIGGVNVRFYPMSYMHEEFGWSYPDINGNYVDVLEITDSVGNNLRPWLNYNVGGGYSFLLRNHNYLQCNLLANFSNKNMVNGTYQINVTGKPQSTGLYSANLSYIGLSFSYIFTGTNKRLRKTYEEKLKSNN
jgi:hypothetical protein